MEASVVGSLDFLRDFADSVDEDGETGSAYGAEENQQCLITPVRVHSAATAWPMRIFLRR